MTNKEKGKKIKEMTEKQRERERWKLFLRKYIWLSNHKDIKYHSNLTNRILNCKHIKKDEDKNKVIDVINGELKMSDIEHDLFLLLRDEIFFDLINVIRDNNKIEEDKTKERKRLEVVKLLKRFKQYEWSWITMKNMEALAEEVNRQNNYDKDKLVTLNDRFYDKDVHGSETSDDTTLFYFLIGKKDEDYKYATDVSICVYRGGDIKVKYPDITNFTEYDDDGHKTMYCKVATYFDIHNDWDDIIDKIKKTITYLEIRDKEEIEEAEKKEADKWRALRKKEEKKELEAKRKEMEAKILKDIAKKAKKKANEKM